MRIVGGTAAGRRLKVPKGFAVRPTPDLVKQALFNSLGERVRQTRILELFAGTGALSLECLSRGANQATCVEKDRHHAEIIRANLATAGLPSASLEIRAQDVFAALSQLAAGGRQFDLILADPPYGEKNVGRRSTSYAQRLLDEPCLARLLPADGLFILGHSKRDTLSLTAPWVERRKLKHGDSLILFLQQML
jgi:16S rRNA (guanine966-N2)-methyltransferase